MGKRKSKTAKQKQAKARQKNGKKTSLGGVAVSKGMTSKFQQAKSSSSVISVQMPNGNGKKITEASVRQKLKATTKKVFMPTPSKAVAAPSGKNNGNNNKNSSKDDEQSEFRRQMASLQERQMAAASQQKKKPKTFSGKSTLSFGFQEASFSLQKTPQQILQETTRQMETMTGVGQQGIGSFSSTPIRTNQSWAVTAKEPSSPMTSKNPFEALGGNGWDDDDDEDNDWRSEKPKSEPAAAGASLFSMAPPTFSLLPRITPTPATSPHPNRFGEEEEEVDPDL